MAVKKTYFLYKIYYGTQCIYLGRTSQSMNIRLHGHFFSKPMFRVLDVHSVNRIEVAKCKTKADMFLYEIYYINLLKPIFNRDDKADDNLTVTLTDLKFKKYTCGLMNKWKEKLAHEETAQEKAIKEFNEAIFANEKMYKKRKEQSLCQK